MILLRHTGSLVGNADAHEIIFSHIRGYLHRLIGRAVLGRIKKDVGNHSLHDIRIKRGFLNIFFERHRELHVGPHRIH